MAAPNLSDLGQPSITDIAANEAALWLWNHVPVVGISAMSIRNRPGTEIITRHQGGRTARLRREIGVGFAGTITLHGGLISSVRTFRNYLTGYGTTYFGVDARSNGLPAGWLTLTQTPPDNTTVVRRLVTWDVIFLDPDAIFEGGVDDLASIVLNWETDARLIDNIHADYYPRRETFTLDGTATTVTLPTTPYRILLQDANYDMGKLVGGDYLFFMKERAAASTLPSGGTPITSGVTVTVGTKVVDIPGAARAAGTIIDLMYLAKISEWT
jgi:hypothetical protein